MSMARRLDRTVLVGALAVAVTLGALIEGALSQPAPQPVDLELVLAVDVSFSMNPEEQALQRQGYVEAFRRPEVAAAIVGGPLGRIAVTYVEWGGHAEQVVPWTLIGGRADAERFASALDAQPLQRISFTSISNALLSSRRLLHANEFLGLRRVVDVSGDGPNNGGAPVPLARDTLLADGIVIDGLAIMLEGALAADVAAIADLDVYYEECVIGGPGAFVMKVADVAGFAEAIRRKLVLEITGPKLTRARPGSRAVRATKIASPAYNCLIGEAKLRPAAP